MEGIGHYLNKNILCSIIDENCSDLIHLDQKIVHGVYYSVSNIRNLS